MSERAAPAREGAQVRLGRPEVVSSSGEVRLVAPVEVAGEVRTWWTSVRTELPVALDLSPAPFLAPAVVVAVSAGEDLVVDGAVSAEQLDGARDWAQTFGAGGHARVPTITAAVAPSPYPAGEEDLLLFSRGIDSTSSLVMALDGTGRPVSSLLYVDGLEPQNTPEVEAAILLDTAAVADLVGLPLRVAATNLRAEVTRWASWESSHSAVLASVAVALGPCARTLLLSSSRLDAVRNPETRVDLDHLWSTDRTAVVLPEPNLGRVDRARVATRRPDLLAHLRVCYEGGRRRNCGRCLKCQHSLTAFAVVGALDLVAPAFDAPLSADTVRGVERVHPSVAAEVRDSLGEEHETLRAAWDEFLAQAANGTRRGFAGLDPWERAIAAGVQIDASQPLGWGPGAVPPPTSGLDLHGLCASPRPLGRPLPWVLADVASPGTSELAHVLSAGQPGGATLLSDPHERPPAAGVARLLFAASVVVWWSDRPVLDGARLLEAVEHGCVPVQFAPADVAQDLRGHLPPRARGLVRTVAVDEVPAGDVTLDELWAAARQLVATAHGGLR